MLPLAAAAWAIAPACSSPGGATSGAGGHAGAESFGGSAGGGTAGTSGSGTAGTSGGADGEGGGQAGMAGGGGAGASGSSGMGGAGGRAGVSGSGGGAAGAAGGGGRAGGAGGAAGGGGRGGGGAGGAAGMAGAGGIGLGGRPAMSGNAVSIALGSTNTCAVLEGGTGRCWGQGVYGILGFSQNNVGDNEYPASTPAVPVGAPVSQLTVGEYHACALLTTGAVRCWGQGNKGQLGYGNTTNLYAPPSKDVNLGGLRAIQIAAGDTHTCALLEGGTVRCWGHAYVGSLGYPNNPGPFSDLLAPPLADIDVGGKVVSIACGGDVSCAILDTGGLRCWGVGLLGRLGYGNENEIGDDETPASVGDVPVGGKVVQVAISFTHTCAVLDTGGVRCWGYADLGELGYGNIANNIGDNETPASVGDVPLGGPAAMVAVGRWHSCALMAAGGVRCWGHALQGELGYGNLTDIGDDETPASAGDVMIGGGAVTAIVAGDEHTCVLLAGGAIRCWGVGAFGRLGYGNEATIGDDDVPASAGDVPF